MVCSIKDKGEFDSQLEAAGDKLVVVDFHATWCGPCKVIAPYFQELSETYEDVVFLKVDVDEAEDIASEYNVSSIPKFVFLKNKAKVDDMCGANENKLLELVKRHK